MVPTSLLSFTATPAFPRPGEKFEIEVHGVNLPTKGSNGYDLSWSQRLKARRGRCQKATGDSRSGSTAPQMSNRIPRELDRHLYTGRGCWALRLTLDGLGL